MGLPQGRLETAGLGDVIDDPGPDRYPGADLGFRFVTACGELVFMRWLMMRAWKIPQPAAAT